jgi:hypothetical protein
MPFAKKYTAQSIGRAGGIARSARRQVVLCVNAKGSSQVQAARGLLHNID